MNNKKGQLIVYSGPSGVGKGTLLAPLLYPNGDLTLSISATTRAPRQGEIDGVHYHFVTKERFEELIAKGDMLEYASYNGNYYGTPKTFVEQQLEEGKDVVLEIEVQGALIVKEACPTAPMIFIAPPSFEVLKNRLVGRATEDEETILARLNAAKQELLAANYYDFIIVNDNIDIAREELKAIIVAARNLVRTNTKIIDEVQRDVKTSYE